MKTFKFLTILRSQFTRVLKIFTSMSSTTRSLRDYTHRPDELFALSDRDLLLLVHGEFSEELRRLNSAYSVGGRKSDVNLQTISPSKILYPNDKDHDEVNRTLISILTLKWIYRDQYNTVVGNQEAGLELSDESFQDIRKFYEETFRNPEELYALMMSVIINDIGKDEGLAVEIANETGEPVGTDNHDMVLVKAVDAGLVKCLDRLTPEYKEDLVRGMRLGADFNFGQLAQAENVPAALETFEIIKGHPRSFKLRFMEQLLDIAGAAGHLDWTGAKKLNQGNYDAYQAVYDAGLGIITHDHPNLRAGYDLVLQRRLDLLRRKGFRELDLNKEDDRALARILCMSSVGDLDTVELYTRAWTSLEDSVKKPLCKALNKDGLNGNTAVQVTYSPALVTQAVDPKGPRSAEEKERSLQSALRYLERVMSAPIDVEGTKSYVERNVLHTLKNVVQTQEFRDDPTILEKAEIPEICFTKP
ncbi:hypothetical protein F4821DRAFT_247422 [Hypoxylon rubiginosum]|uniref:Uncharacterized protein n=1 Tax=Hypoxylon rubiginosum TaxID=110542 RepID=A0ACC0CPI6_9PEZI|nr:hypothetical protein F4821DRAFT_247422 [Hypoxylon rubiginosum]